MNSILDTRILLSRGISSTSRLISWWTWSTEEDEEYGISHAELWLPDRTIIEAALFKARNTDGSRAKSGVRVTDHISVGHSVGTKIDVYRFKDFVKEEQIQAFVDFIRAQVGKKYDLRGLLGFGIRKNIQDPGKWFCSEVLAAAAIYAGVPLIGTTPAYKIPPGLISQSFVLEKEGSVIITKGDKYEEIGPVGVACPCPA